MSGRLEWFDPENKADVLGPLKGIDPSRTDLHALWAGGSHFSGYRSEHDADGNRVTSVMVEFAVGASWTVRAIVLALINAPRVYWSRQPPANFVTGQVTLSDVVKLAGLAGVRRWRLGLAQTARLDTDESLIPPLGFVPTDVPWVAIIDHGIAFAHRAFRWPGKPAKTRVQLLWDQDRTRHGSPLPKGWRPAVGLGYGGCLRARDINVAIATGDGDEARVYRDFQYGPAMHRVSHGTHVLDLAAGQPHPLAPPGKTGSSWDGCAARAPIIAVQLPYRPDKDTSGAGLGVQVLDALHFISTYAKGNRRVIVNLSDGAYGGRHDGRSMTEEAIDDFLRVHDRVELVIAAGNAGDQRLHAASTGPLASGKRVGVDWVILPDDSSDSFCEVWCDGPAREGQLTLSVTLPGGAPVAVPLGHHSIGRVSSAAYAQCAVLSSVDAVNHAGQPGFLVTAGPTRPVAAAGTRAPHGRWRLELANNGPESIGAVHVWVERDNPVANDSGPRRQSFLQPYEGGGLLLERGRTLGSLAGCGEAFVVAGHGRRGLWPDGTGRPPTVDSPPYVSHGPGRALQTGGPDVSAPCEDSPVLHGLLAAGNRSGSRFRMNGTSVAAPLVTRWLVERLSGPNPPTRQQLRDELTTLGRVEPGPLLTLRCGGDL